MKLSFDKNGKFVHIKFTGKLTAVEILKAFDVAVYHKNYQPGMGRLWDFTDADLSDFTSGIISEMAQYSLKFPEGINDVKVAFVVSRTVEYGLARMFEAFSNKANTKIMVYYDMNNAVKWLSSN